MKAANCETYDRWNENPKAVRKVIYLEDHRPARSRRRVNTGDAFWNIVFGGLCLTVLVLLFCL